MSEPKPRYITGVPDDEMLHEIHAYRHIDRAQPRVEVTVSELEAI